VEVTYDGPKFEDTEAITPKWMVQLMEHLRDQKKLHKKFVLMILIKIMEILKALPPLVEEEIPLYFYLIFDTI